MVCFLQAFFIFITYSKNYTDLKDYLSKWNYKRLIQFGFGIFLIYYYLQDHNKFALAIAIIMLLQSLLNVGCFSTKGCNTPSDEIHTKKDFAKKIKEMEKD